MEGAQEDNGQGHEEEHNLKGRGRDGPGGGAYHTHTIYTQHCTGNTYMNTHIALYTVSKYHTQI